MFLSCQVLSTWHDFVWNIFIQQYFISHYDNKNQILNFCLKTFLYTFLVNKLDVDSTLESADDITAAETAPRPRNDTTGGVRCCRTIDRIKADWPFSAGVRCVISAYDVAVQSERNWIVSEISRYTAVNCIKNASSKSFLNLFVRTNASHIFFNIARFHEKARKFEVNVTSFTTTQS